MTADPCEQARPALDRIRETTEQLGGRPALADPFARDHASSSMQAGAPD